MDSNLRVMITKEEIEKRITELANQINHDYKGNTLTIIAVLTGSFVLAADLVRKLDLDVEVSFIYASSYGDSTKSSGVVKMQLDVKSSLEGRDVLLVEDIVDTGLTIEYLKKHILLKKPHSLKVCTLLDKPERRTCEGVFLDYCGFEIPDKFVVGFGLDSAQKYRQLPYIAEVVSQ